MFSLWDFGFYMFGFLVIIANCEIFFLTKDAPYAKVEFDLSLMTLFVVSIIGSFSLASLSALYFGFCGPRSTLSAPTNGYPGSLHAFYSCPHPLLL